MAHGHVHVLQGHHAHGAGRAVAVRVHHQVQRAPHANQQIGKVAEDDRRQVGARAFGQVGRHGVGDGGAVAVDRRVATFPDEAVLARHLGGALELAAHLGVGQVAQRAHVGVGHGDVRLQLDHVRPGGCQAVGAAGHARGDEREQAARLVACARAVDGCLLDG